MVGQNLKKCPHIKVRKKEKKGGTENKEENQKCRIKGPKRRKEGRETGRKEGREGGRKGGREGRREEGREGGRKEGRKEGRNEGRKEDWLNIKSICHSLGFQ